MANHEKLSVDEARQLMEQSLGVYDIMAQGGVAGSEEEQGENWMRTDPRERRVMNFFLEQLEQASEITNTNAVLVGGCSDGLAAEVLAKEAYVPTGIDFSAEMVAASRHRFESQDLPGIFIEGDITNIEGLDEEEFAGATLIHVAPCIPIVGEEDELLKAAISNLSSRAPQGPLLVSTTYYRTYRGDDLEYTREFLQDDEKIGETTYYRHDPVVIEKILNGLGREVLHAETFGAYSDAFPDDPGYGYDYKNDYIVAGPVGGPKPGNFDQTFWEIGYKRRQASELPASFPSFRSTAHNRF